MREIEHLHDPVPDAPDEWPDRTATKYDALPTQFSLGRLFVALLAASITIGLFTNPPQWMWPFLAGLLLAAAGFAVFGLLGVLISSSIWATHTLDYDQERKAYNIRMAQRMLLWSLLAIVPFVLMVATLVANSVAAD